METCATGKPEDREYIRPYPRIKRACDPCRARKIRCLRGEKGPNCDVCRRCTTYGYQCTYTPVRARNTRERPISTPEHVVCETQTDEDIVAHLCKAKLPMYDGLTQVLDVHRRAFQDQMPQHSSLYRNATSIPTPESIDQASPTTGSSNHHVEPNLNINMKEAEKLLTLFRKRKFYFPFIEIPETTSAASMAIHQPFLLLSILTVASSRTPSLQQRTDERFRRVLSERVVLRGEQSLDYVQGLLVYIAWFPLHLHPVRSQLFQYIRIANSMISDLELDSCYPNPNTKSLDTCLGCFSLKSHLSGIFPRGAKESPPSYLQSLQESLPYILANTHVQYARLHELAGRITGYTPACGHSTQAPDSRAACKPNQIDSPNHHSHGQTPGIMEKLEEFSNELDTLEMELASEVRNQISIRLTLLFTKLSISFLPFKPPSHSKTKRQPEQQRLPGLDSSNAEILDMANTCLSDIKTFLETILSTPLEEYPLFSIREWSELIVTISIASHLCFYTPETCDPAGWTRFQRDSRAKILIYLESMTHRMGTLSASSSATACPDTFCMFKSVLGILMQTFAPSITSADSLSLNQATPSSETPTQSEQDPNPGTRSQSSSAAISRCPVMNGSIQQTDYWRALESNANTTASHSMAQRTAGDCGAGQRESSLEGYTVDDLLQAPQDWPSVFSDWVVDLGNLPE
ncbi:hypothetical protein BJX64DRAFT_256771 [Aspergillus heterothallicus]